MSKTKITDILPVLDLTTSGIINVPKRSETASFINLALFSTQDHFKFLYKVYWTILIGSRK